MRKRIFTAMLAALTGLSLVGCSLADIRNDNSNTDKPDTVDVPDVSGSNIGTDSSDTNAEPSNTSVVPNGTIVYDGAYAIFQENYDTIYVIDSYDTLITSYNRARFEEIESLQDDGLENANFVGYDQGVFYFLHDNWSNSEYYSTLYAVDGTTNTATVVCHYSKDETISSVDIYDGMIYVTFYNVGNRENKYFEDIYVKKDDAFEYELEGESCTDFLGKQKVTGIFTNPINSAHHKYCNESVLRTIENYGCIIAETSGKYEKINAGGSVQMLDLDCTGITIWGYDSRYVVLTAYDEEHFGQYIYCYDTVNNSYITIGEADASILGFADGYIYYATDESEEYGIINNHIYKYDPYTDVLQELYDLYSVPGVNNINPGVTGFCYVKDHVLFLNCVSGDVGWTAVYYDEAGATYKNLGCTVATVNSIKYGTVSSTSIVKTCPFCNTVLMSYITEIYQVNEDVTPAFEVINEYLRQDELNNYDKYISDYYDLEDSSLCDIHNTIYLASYTDIRVTNVDIINDKYITVKYENNSYMGGAHGSYESKQYMFDLSTGEIVKIENLYPGTEIEFREFIADKTRSDYLANPDRYYSNSNGAQGVYESAYESAKFADVDMEFYADKAYVVYHEYEMGPYVAGEIRIEISYSELLGRDEL